MPFSARPFELPIQQHFLQRGTILNSNASPIESPEMARKRRSTIFWVIGLAFIGLVFDGYDLVVYGAVLPGFMGPDAAKWIGDLSLIHISEPTRPY